MTLRGWVLASWLLLPVVLGGCMQTGLSTTAETGTETAAVMVPPSEIVAVRDAAGPMRVPVQDVAPPPAPYPTPYPAPYPAPYAGPCPPPCPAPCPPPPCWSGCGLPCEEGISQWHLRALGGYAFGGGTDAPSDCLYLGADFGRTFCGTCGCFGLDAFYRTHQSRFDRDPGGKDGGRFHHVGVKATYEKSFGRSRFFGYVGAGPEYFWTEDYLDDDSGFGVFGEAGVGYVFTQNLRVRAGVNVHGMDTDVGRKDPADDGESRWLWIIAPTIGIEVDF